MRYALVIGVNSGAPEQGLPDLANAERDAGRLFKRLKTHGLYSAERIHLLQNADREGILSAGAALSGQVAADRAALPAARTTFTLFYSGHGLKGQLTTSGAPLTTGDVAGLFRQIGADLNIGIFDACFSAAISGKSVEVRPRFNPLEELPSEAFGAKGTIFITSSSAEEQSYEHGELGGLFTHYFNQAFERAEPDAVGIELQSMWEYASRMTSDHAARLGLKQTPRLVMRDVEFDGKVFFSFPEPRSATLYIMPGLTGELLVRYARGDLVERVRLPEGKAVELPVFAGQIDLYRFAEGRRSTPVQVDVPPGGVVAVHPATLAPPLMRTPGYGTRSLTGKGVSSDTAFTIRRPALTLALGLGYHFSSVPDDRLGARHAATISLWSAWHHMSAGAELSLGQRNDGFEPGESTAEVGGMVHGGLGLTAGPVRLDAEFGLGARIADQSLESRQAGGRVTTMFGRTGLRASHSITVGAGDLVLQVAAGADLALWSPANPAVTEGEALGLVPNASARLLWAF